MRKLWVCLFYSLCIFTIVFSLFWMALPRLPFPSADSTSAADQPSAPAQADTASPARYYLCDEGGRVTVYRCDSEGVPATLVLRTSVYVNLLPESDALRLKQGVYLSGETRLRQLLEDLGG